MTEDLDPDPPTCRNCGCPHSIETACPECGMTPAEFHAAIRGGGW